VSLNIVVACRLSYHQVKLAEVHTFETLGLFDRSSSSPSAPHTRPTHGSQDHHPSKNWVQKIIRCNTMSNDPDEGRMYPKHVELRVHQ